MQTIQYHVNSSRKKPAKHSLHPPREPKKSRYTILLLVVVRIGQRSAPERSALSLENKKRADRYIPAYILSSSSHFIYHRGKAHCSGSGNSDRANNWVDSRRRLHYRSRRRRFDWLSRLFFLSGHIARRSVWATAL